MQRRLPMGSIAHLEKDKKEFTEEVHRHAQFGVYTKKEE